MTPTSSKRPRETYKSTAMTPSRAHKRLLYSAKNSDDDDDWMDSDVEVIRFDPDCILEDPDLEEEENDSEEWDSLDSCMEEEEEEEEMEEFLDATQTMETDSFDVSSLYRSLDIPPSIP